MGQEEIVAAALSRIAAFEGLDERVLAMIARAGKLVRIPRRRVLFRRGQAVGDAYVVLSGTVGLYRGDDPDSPRLGEVEAGSVLGAAALLDRDVWPVYGMAQSDALLFGFGVALEELLAGRVGSLCQTLAHRLRRVDALCNLKPSGGSNLPDLPEELYAKEHTCPCCGAVVVSCAVRSRFLRVTHTSADFYQVFEGPNPLYYEVIVCDACGYVFDELEREPLNVAARRAVREQCAAFSDRSWGGPRTCAQAIEVYQRALQCQETVGARASVRGRTYLKLGWLYRSIGDENAEKKAVQEALSHYLVAYEREPSSDVKLELRLLYLIGELHRQLGRRYEAVQWFGRVLTHPRREANPQIVRMAREQWQDMKRR